MTNKTIKKLGNDIYKIGKYTGIAVTLPFAAPTYLRKFSKNEEDSDEGIDFYGKHIEYENAFFAAMVCGGIEAAIVNYTFDGGDAWVLPILAMIATNNISVEYEVVRDKLISIKDEKIMKEKQKNLESRIKNNNSTRSPHIY